MKKTLLLVILFFPVGCFLAHDNSRVISFREAELVKKCQLVNWDDPELFQELMKEPLTDDRKGIYAFLRMAALFEKTDTFLNAVELGEQYGILMNPKGHDARLYFMLSQLSSPSKGTGASFLVSEGSISQEMIPALILSLDDRNTVGGAAKALAQLKNHSDEIMPALIVRLFRHVEIKEEFGKYAQKEYKKWIAYAIGELSGQAFPVKKGEKRDIQGNIVLLPNEETIDAAKKWAEEQYGKELRELGLIEK